MLLDVLEANLYYGIAEFQKNIWEYPTTNNRSTLKTSIENIQAGAEENNGILDTYEAIDLSDVEAGLLEEYREISSKYRNIRDEAIRSIENDDFAQGQNQGVLAMEYSEDLKELAELMVDDSNKSSKELRSKISLY